MYSRNRWTTPAGTSLDRRIRAAEALLEAGRISKAVTVLRDVIGRAKREGELARAVRARELLNLFGRNGRGQHIRTVPEVGQ